MCLALVTQPGDRVWVACSDGVLRGARMPEAEAEAVAAQAKAAAVAGLIFDH